MFKAHGHSRVSVLDGGEVAWEECGGTFEGREEISSEGGRRGKGADGTTGTGKEAAFQADPRTDSLLRTHAQVAALSRALTTGVSPMLLIDTRPFDRYSGEVGALPF